MTEKILFVDDDPNILSALQRQLRGKFSIHTATGAEPALSLIQQGEKYAVVVSDLSMPGMNGIQFLMRVNELSPESVRVMLTGTADIDAAMAAVNESNIFRFLTKPVESDVIAKTLDASVHQYRLVTAERELLNNTLNGSIRVLVDLLSLASPLTFKKASRITEYVNQIATQLMVPNTWQFELAGLLSQIGCMMLPAAILDKIHAGQELTEEEHAIFSAHPLTAKGLLMNIPRMEAIAQMIAGQLEPYSSFDNQTSGAVKLGASMLKVALDYDSMLEKGMLPDQAISLLYDRDGEYDERLVNALAF